MCANPEVAVNGQSVTHVEVSPQSTSDLSRSAHAEQAADPAAHAEQAADPAAHAEQAADPAAHFERRIKIADITIKGLSLVAVPFSIWFGAQQLIRNEEFKRQDIRTAREAPYDKEVATITLKTLTDIISIITDIENICDSEIYRYGHTKEKMAIVTHSLSDPIKERLYTVARGPIWLVGDDRFLDNLKMLYEELEKWDSSASMDVERASSENNKNRVNIRKLCSDIRQECRRLTEAIRSGHPVLGVK